MLKQGEGDSGGDDAEIGHAGTASDLEGVSYRGVSGQLNRSGILGGSIQ